MKNIDLFLQKKIKEINFALCQQNNDMFDLIGSVRDIFSSAYLTDPIVDSAIVHDLWKALLAVFINSDVYGNKFDSILTMSYIYIYAKRQNIYLCLDELKKWRIEQVGKNISPELLECIDDILNE